MKYACENCYTCCITASSEVTYCALANQCKQTVLSYHQALSFTVLITFLLGGALAFLYFAFRNRQLAQAYRQERQSVAENKAQAKVVAASSEPKFSKRSNLNEIKINEQLQIQSKISHRFKHKPKKSARPAGKASPPQETQRGLR